MLIPTAVFAWITCVLLQGAVFTPLVRARGVHCITALLILLASASLTTLTILLVSGSLASATFSLPAFYGGLLLALAALLVVPSILLLGLSSLLLLSLLSSFLSTCLLYLYSRVPMLGFEYDADGALHFSALVLTTLVGVCGIGCLLVGIAGRLTCEEEERTSKQEAVVSNGAEVGQDAYVDIDSLQADEELSSEQYSLNSDSSNSSVPASSSAFSSSSFSSSNLWPPLPFSLPSMRQLTVMSSQQLSRAAIRLTAGLVTCLLSALLYCLHLIPIYATQRDGLLRMLSLDKYLLSIHLGLLLITVVVCPAILYTVRSLTRERRTLFLSPLLTVGCCVGGAVGGSVYWWLLAYMPSHAHISKGAVVAEYEWYFYSAGSDALSVAAQTVPRLTLTALTWAVAKEHKVAVPTKGVEVAEQRGTRGEMHEMNSMLVDEDDEQVEEREEVVKAVSTRVSWSTVSLWCLALVLGAVSDGVAAFAWDEGY